MKLILIFVLICVCVFAQDDFDLFAVKKNCDLKYATDFPDKESVLLWKSSTGYDLIEPENDGIVLKSNQQIAIACPGARNLIANVSEALVTAKCVGGTTLKVGTKNFDLKELGCTTSVTGEFLESEEECGNSGIIKHLGHNIGEEFNIVIDVCYDNELGGALYADHIIYGSAVSHSSSGSGRPGFKVGGVAPGVSADNAYKQATQKTTFAKTLGSVALADKYIFPNSYLARGHLAPDADQVYVTSQLTTYFYINTVPQWQQINNGNWKSLETALRNVATATGENFQVFTGSHEVLALANSKGKLTEIYLSDNKLPVPKFVWKVFYSLETNKGIAFVSVNNPFVTKVSDEHYLCEDICDKYGWGTAAWKNPAKGLVYCCEVDDLRETVPIVPELDVVDVQEANVNSVRSYESLVHMMNEKLNF